LILSDNNTSFKRNYQDKGYGTRRNDFQNYDVEYSMSRLFDRELEFMRNLQIVTSDLFYRQDYTVTNLFSAFDNYNQGFLVADKLTFFSFRKYLVRSNMNMMNGDLEAIVRRFDINRDRRITIRELKTICYSSNQMSSNSNMDYNNNSLSYNNNNSMSSPRRRLMENNTESSSQYRNNNYYSPIRNNDFNQNSYNNTSNNYHSPKRDMMNLSPNRYNKQGMDMMGNRNSPMRNNQMRNSPMRNSPMRNSGMRNSPMRNNQMRNSPNRSKGEYMQDNYEEANFQSFLQDIIMWENEVERLKCDLALRSDFNLPDAYRLFEVDKRGYFSDQDFKYGANFVDVFPTSEDVLYTFRRYTNGGEIQFT
jgi:hypothetical protein